MPDAEKRATDVILSEAKDLRIWVFKEMQGSFGACGPSG
jgi:hypothetical protein